MVKKVILIRSRAIDPAVHKVASSLSQNGFDVKLLLWDRQNDFTWSNTHLYKIHTFTMRAPYDDFTIMLYLPFWWMYEIFFLLTNRSDIIHACDLDTLLPALLIKFINKNIKICYTIYDFYSENIINKNFFTKIMKYLLSRLEIVGIGYCEILFLVDKSRYIQVKNAKIKSIEYIYNTPTDYTKYKILKKSNDFQEIVVFYAGIILRSRGIFSLITAMNKLENVKLVIAGLGPEKKQIEEISKKNNNIQYLGQISYEDVVERTNESDVVFAFYDPNIPNNKYASPNKLFEAMMCEKPILANEGTSMAEIIKREKCGIVVPYNNISEIRKALIILRDEPSLRKKFGKNGRIAYEQKYNWSVMELNLLKAYKSLFLYNLQ